MKREPISKRTRFEIFKRDGFRCQYCGRSAPDVLLAVDHIEPVSKGGTNEAFNLITSCRDCNSGKGAIRLSDKTLIEKTAIDIEDLEEKRRQIEAVAAYKLKQAKLKETEVDEAAKVWKQLSPRFTLNKAGREFLGEWIAKFGFNKVVDAMQVAATKYLHSDKNGHHTEESWCKAFYKISGIAFLSDVDQHTQQAFYIRGILKNRIRIQLSPSELDRFLQKIKAALKSGVEFKYLKSLAIEEASSWDSFDWMLDEIAKEIAEAKSLKA